jgi:hypothetical protein
VAGGRWQRSQLLHSPSSQESIDSSDSVPVLEPVPLPLPPLLEDLLLAVPLVLHIWKVRTTMLEVRSRSLTSLTWIFP